MRHTRINFLWLKFGVISTTKTAHNQGANNESQKLFFKRYFARHFYGVLKLWVTDKCMCSDHHVKRNFCVLLLLPWKLLKFSAISRIKKCFFIDFSNFSKFIQGNIRRKLYHLYDHVLSKTKTACTNGLRLIFCSWLVFMWMLPVAMAI